jgi:ABC-type iron transport system FetAB ATPase subunit
MPQLRLEQFSPEMLSPLDLLIDAGETVTLSGPSGSGKSQLLRAIADLDPHRGTARLDGTAAEEIPAPVWRRRVGYLPAQSYWWRELVAEHFSKTPQLEALGLKESIMQSPVEHLSSGERQRLAVARLLQQSPRALLLDEPTANLDPHHTQLVEQWIVQYQRRNSVPILWVSHDAAQRRRIGSRHLQIRDGQVIAA